LIWIAHIKIEGKHFFAHIRQIPGSISKIQSKLTVTVAIWKIIYKSLFSCCLTSFYLTLPKNNVGIGLPIPKLRKTTFLHMSRNRFLEVIQKFQAS